MQYDTIINFFDMVLFLHWISAFGIVSITGTYL